MRKYKKGPKVTSLDELMEQEFVYWNDKIEPYGWFQNWQIHMAHGAIQSGIIFKVIKTEDKQ